MSFLVLTFDAMKGAPAEVKDWIAGFSMRFLTSCDVDPAEKVPLVVVPAESCWEYRCSCCRQLRFYPKEREPPFCGNCGSRDIVIARPGTLPG